MKPLLRRTTAILLFAIAGPNLANAQTLMDYVISRDEVWGAECAPTPEAGCAAPVSYGQGWQTSPECAIPTVPAYSSGWQPSAACAVPAAPQYVAGMPGACAAPPACCPRSTSADVCYTTEPTCAIPSTPTRIAHAPSACRCGQDGCNCRHGSQCHGGSKRSCCCCSGWKRAHTTGDLYPHFPYPPEHGGYYYFRPYNWETVHEHVAYATQWGLHTGNPYSVSMFDIINEEFEQRFPRGAGSIPEPPRRRERALPNLEDLVRPLP